MMKTLSAILVALLMVPAGVAVGDADCGLTAARQRNGAELVCYDTFGPKSAEWSILNQGPLNACLSEVTQTYRAQAQICNPNPPPRDGYARVDPRKGAVAASALGLLISVFVAP